jgi:hypothetical protein
MHDRTRRLICRWLFLLLALLPSTLLMGWSVYERSDAGSQARLARWQLKLEQVLQADVSIDAVRPIFPGTVVLENVIVRLPGSSSRLVTVKSIRLSSRQPASIHLEQVILPVNQLDRWRGWLERWSCQFDPGQSLRVTAQSVIFQRPDGGHPFGDLVGVIRGSEEATEATFNLWQEGSAGDPLAVQCAQDHNRPGETRWIVQTGSTPLATRLLAELVPGFARLGSQGSYEGYFSVLQTADDCELQLLGRLDKIDLGLLSGRPLSGMLSGSAAIDIRQCLVQGGACQLLDATLHASSGTVDANWLQSLVRSWGGTPLAAARGQRLPYSQLQCRIELTREGIRLSSPSGDAVLRLGEQVIVPAPAAAWLSIPTIVSLLAPPGSEQLPATADSIRLFQALRPDAGQVRRE